MDEMGFLATEVLMAHLGYLDSKENRFKLRSSAKATQQVKSFVPLRRSDKRVPKKAK